MPEDLAISKVLGVKLKLRAIGPPAPASKCQLTGRSPRWIFKSDMISKRQVYNFLVVDHL